MYSHFSTYFIPKAYQGMTVVYSNGHADNPSNSFWIVPNTWLEFN
jgi:hypothetical protein